jgi:hypothetical protein
MFASPLLTARNQVYFFGACPKMGARLVLNAGQMTFQTLPFGSRFFLELIRV